MANKNIYNTTTYLVASAYLKKHFDIPQWMTDKLNKYYSAWLGNMPTDNTGEFLQINQWVGATDLKAQEEGMYYWMNKYKLVPHDKTFFGFVGAHMFLNKWPLNNVSHTDDGLTANSKVMFEDIMQDYFHGVVQEAYVIIHGDE